MKWNRFFIVIGGLALIAHLIHIPVAYAKLYTWTDRTGKVRRTYYPPPADQVLQEQATTQKPTTTKKSIKQNQVELYITSWCPYCKKAIQYFKSRGISYKVYDIEKDRNAAARKNKLDYKSGVPFAVVNGTGIHGYSPEGYGKALKQ